MLPTREGASWEYLGITLWGKWSQHILVADKGEIMMMGVRHGVAMAGKLATPNLKTRTRNP